MPRSRAKASCRIPINRYPFTPAIYPGRRPRFSFFFTPKGIHRFTLRTLGHLLESRGLPPVSERYAVLAYGSNACPGQLHLKYKSYGLTNVPVLYGRLSGAEAVYARRKTNGGYIPATLARTDDDGPSWITLLAADQFEAMDTSEGRPDYYVLAEVPDVQFSIGRSRFQTTPLYSYANIQMGVMTLNDRAVTLRSTTQKRCQEIYDATQSSPAEKFLNFVTIPDLDPPGRPSQILRK